jgi:hypothetical protein
VSERVNLAVGHHVTGDAYRYKHGWIPIGPVTAVKPETTKYASAVKFLNGVQNKAEEFFHKELRHDAGIGGYFGEQPQLATEMTPGNPARAWAFYQTQPYQQINHYLRTGENNPGDWFDAKTEAKAIGKAFDVMGVDTPKPFKLYRGLSSKGQHDWNKEIQVGQTYQDLGVTSTATSVNDVTAFLQSNNLDMNAASDVMLEIHVPKGTRVLAGSPVGSELMLKPGTKFRVLKKGIVTGHAYFDGAGSTFTKYVVEIVK